MTVQTEAPPVPSAPEPAAPAAPAPAAPAAPAQPPAPVPQPPAAAQPPVQPAAPQQAPAAPGDTTDWKAEAERARAEAAQAKQAAEQWKAQSRRQESRSKANHEENKTLTEVLRQVAEKVGVEFDDRPDPEVLQQRLDAQTQLARQRAVELAVYTSASASGVNATAMLDSRDFMARTAQLDPDAPDFTSQLSGLVKEAAGQPRYQFQQAPTAQVQEQGQPQPPPQPPATQQPPAQDQQPPAPTPPAPASGANFSGAPGGNRLWTQADLDNALANDRDGTIVSKAIEQGLLVNLGIGKPRKTSRR